ncbi:MAG: hypothetical protein GVY36_01360 [Verrucomicrobia bacterium]|jgi:hypothetical protein|nr:hypothetical protein [Verrucomicrobiota bacterium]
MSETEKKQPSRTQRLLHRPFLLILLGSLALHLLGGLIFGSWKVFTLLTKDEEELTVVVPPEAIQPKKREYQLKTMRSQRATALSTQVPIAVDQPSDLNLPKIDVPKPDTSRTKIEARGAAGDIGGNLGGGAGGSGFATLFGNTSPLAGALEGTFIDFKQDRYREKPPNEGWMEAGKDFLRNYRLREFRKFFNAPQKLYATHFYIPLMNANEAPRAYGVENLVEPSQWVAVYQGQFRSVDGGEFRFVGTADDILIVGVDGKTVLSAGFTQYNPTRWSPREEPRFPGPPVSQYLPALTVGDWFKLPAGEPVDLTVTIGEIPGGEFASYLFIEEKGVQYETTPEGRPILPVFKLKDLSQAERQTIQADGYPKRLDGPTFGFF